MTTFTAVLTDADRFPFAEDETARLTEHGVTLVEVDGHDDQHVIAAADVADALFVYSASVGADVVDALRRCRIIMRCGSGFERIDVTAAAERGITVAYVPGYGSVDVAEHALALILAVARRVVDGAASVHRHQWPSYHELGRMHRLRDRTLGLIGYGRIARELAGMARGLGMAVIAHDPFVEPSALDADGVTPVGLVELVAGADVISVHVPLSPDTERIVDDRLLAHVRPGSLIVNVSRGELVDEDALIRALEDGRLAGAGLDVLAIEPPEPESALLRLPNVVITPHSAAFTDEALVAVRGQAVDEVVRVLGGGSPRHPVPRADRTTT